MAPTQTARPPAGLGWPFAMLLIALGALYTAMVPFGLPQQLDPDEHIFLRSALHMVDQRTLDPAWYGAPAHTIIHALALCLAAIAQWQVWFGDAPSVGAVVQGWTADPQTPMIVGRMLCVGFTGLLLLAQALVLRRLGAGSPVILMATLVLGVLPTTLSWAAIVRMDLLLTALMLLLVHQALRLSRQPTRQGFVAAGVLVALATLSKWPGVVAALMVPLAAGRAVRLNRLAWPRALGWTALAAAVSVAVAFALSPAVFLRFGDVLAQVAGEARSFHLSVESLGPLAHLSAYLGQHLPAQLGWPLYGLGVVGMLVLSWRRGIWLLSALMVLFLAFISALALLQPRWVIPLLAMLTIFAALVVQAGLRRLPDGGRGWVTGVLCAAAAALMLAPVAAQSVTIWQERALGLHPLVAAYEDTLRQIPRGAGVLVEPYAPALSVEDYRVFILLDGHPEPWAEQSPALRPPGFFRPIGWGGRGHAPAAVITRLREAGIEWVWLGTFERRFSQDPGDWREELALYRALAAASEVVYRTEEAPHAPRLLRLRSGGP